MLQNVKKHTHLFTLPGVLFIAVFCLFFCSVIPANAAKTYDSDGFYYTLHNKEITIVGTSIQEKHLVIPKQIDQFPVTAIGRNAFRGNNFERITIPNSVSQISSYAFERSQKLKNITISGDLDTISYACFANCPKLTGVTIRSDIKSIDARAFYNCSKLQKIKLPDSVKFIDDYAFAYCYKLQKFPIGKKLNTIGKNAFYRNYTCTKLVIPASVKSIDSNAFGKCSDLENVRFACQNTVLGDSVFRGCTSLRSIVLPKNMKNIPEYTFYNCSSLRQIKLPAKIYIIKKRAFSQCSSLTYIKMNPATYAIGDHAFAGSGLKKIVMNHNMEFIGNGAFEDTNLTHVTLGSKISLIGRHIFLNCSRLKTVNIPASVIGINVSAFEECPSLTAINIASGNKNYRSINGVLYNKDCTTLIQYPEAKKDRSFTTPGTVKTIRSNAFSENKHLQSATITAKTIGSSAFASMSSLTCVTLKNAVTISSSAFSDDVSLTRLVLPDSVKTIKSLAFSRCPLQTLHIPNSLHDFYPSALSECYKLSSFTGGTSGCCRVVDNVLYNRAKTKLILYPSLKKDRTFTLPDSVKEISSNAFCMNNNLTKLTFGKHFRTLNSGAIADLPKLKSVVFTSSRLGYISRYGISDCDNLAVIVGPNNYKLNRLAKKAKTTLISY